MSDVKASVAALRFIVCNAVKFEVEEQVPLPVETLPSSRHRRRHRVLLTRTAAAALLQVLHSELMQLGLPKEHADELLNHYGKQSLALRQQFAESSFRLTQLNAVDWRVRLLLA